MATPMRVFAEIAKRYLPASATEEQVDEFFQTGILELPKSVRQEILAELLDLDGEEVDNADRAP